MKMKSFAMRRFVAGLVILAASSSALFNEFDRVFANESLFIEKPLKSGDRGPKIEALQKFLNLREETRVAASGAGSSGNETDYFGPLTKAAVVKFQELYRDDILSPAGLSGGTGYVGSLTAKKINSLSSPSSPAAKKGGETVQKPAPKIFSVSPEHAVAGTLLTLNGSGFDALDNTVYASFNKLTGIPSTDGKTIQFVVKEPFPADLEVPDFIRKEYKTIQYGFYVKNRYGRSNDILFTLDLVKP